MTSATPDPGSEPDPGQAPRTIYRIGSETQIVDTTVKGGHRDPGLTNPPESLAERAASHELIDQPAEIVAPDLEPAVVPRGDETPRAGLVVAPVSGATTVLPAVGGDPSPAGESTTTVDTRTAARTRRVERRVMALSTLLGTLGLAVAFAAAALDQLRYNQPGPCATYAAAHEKQVGFGCSATAKHVAVLLPGIGIVALVVIALAVVWIPQQTPRARLAWMVGYVGLLVLAAVAVAVAYSALPQNS